MDVAYVLPIRCGDGCGGHPDLLANLQIIHQAGAEIVVADGSPSLPAHAVFDRFRHVQVQARPSANGKVVGVHAGIAASSRERIVIADDDVRYDPATLVRVAELLDDADLVVPQNRFVEPVPWHGLWDTGRTLLNRALGHDYPGTLGVRRSWFVRTGGYHDEVLFENLELMRTVAASGGTTRYAPDVYVPRLAPDVATFRNQRVRQAYDDLAQPWRLAAMLAVVPFVVANATRPRRLALAAGAIVGLAEHGRRRHGGASHFPVAGSFAAPLWILERGVCVWIAVALRVFRGGVRYRDGRLRVAASSLRSIRRRLEAVPSTPRASRRTAASSASDRTGTEARPLV